MYKGGGGVRPSHKDQGRYIRFTSRVLQRPEDANRLRTN
jgi:hypothetical protein